MFGLGTGEILLIIVAILLLFGAKRIPEVMRSMAQGLKEFKKATSDATTEIKRAVDDAEPEPTQKDPPRDEQN